MSQQAAAVLTRWIAEWVHPVPKGSIGKEAERLATEFIAYATDAGMNLERLEEEIGQDLVSRMEDALVAEAATESGDDLVDDE